MSITYYVRFIGDDPVAIYRIVEDDERLRSEVLSQEGWQRFPDAIRYHVGGNMEASEATADQAKQVADRMGLPFSEP